MPPPLLRGIGNATSCFSLANLRSCHVHDLRPSTTKLVCSFPLYFAPLSPNLPFPRTSMTRCSFGLASTGSVQSNAGVIPTVHGAKPRWIRDASSVQPFVPWIDDGRRPIERGAPVVPFHAADLCRPIATCPIVVLFVCRHASEKLQPCSSMWSTTSTSSPSSSATASFQSKRRRNTRVLAHP